MTNPYDERMKGLESLEKKLRKVVIVLIKTASPESVTAYKDYEALTWAIRKLKEGHDL